MALTGKNRAEGIGKHEEARIFMEWLASHLDTSHVPACEHVPGGRSGVRDAPGADSEPPLPDLDDLVAS
jgi:hypothetical protein